MGFYWFKYIEKNTWNFPLAVNIRQIKRNNHFPVYAEVSKLELENRNWKHFHSSRAGLQRKMDRYRSLIFLFILFNKTVGNFIHFKNGYEYIYHFTSDSTIKELDNFQTDAKVSSSEDCRTHPIIIIFTLEGAG